jgi:hypothetical protein
VLQAKIRHDGSFVFGLESFVESVGGDDGGTVHYLLSTANESDESCYFCKAVSCGCWCRWHPVYCPFHLDGRVVSNFIIQALQSKPLTVYGKGDQTRSFQFVSHLVNGLHALMKGNYYKPVNLGNPDEYSVKDFAEYIKRMTKSSRKSSICPRIKTIRPNENPISRLPVDTLDGLPK